MCEDQSFQSNGELDIAAAHHVLNLKVQELCWEPELLHHTGIFSGSEPRLFLTRWSHRDTSNKKENDFVGMTGAKYQ